LLKNIRAGILWSRAIGKLHAGDGEAAIDLIKRIEKLVPFKPYHVVMLAHAEVLENNHDRAATDLRSALDMMDGNQSANARYLKLHVRALLSLIEGGDYDALQREAAQIACTPRLKRWFPTPEHPRET
jgi:hypothetical protein